MKLAFKIICLVAIANLVGCSKEPAAEKPTAQLPQAEALMKAKQVEQILEQGAQQEREEIQQQTQ